MKRNSDRAPLSTMRPSGQPLVLDAQTTALIVVDLQYFDAHRDWGEGRTASDLGVSSNFEPYFQRIDEILPNVQELLTEFRAHEAEVIHVRVSELTADSRDVSKKQLLRGLVVPSTSKEAEFLTEVAPMEDEIVFDKSSSGMFPATNVDRILRNLDITTLVFCGTSTGGCVESAVRDAIDLGYRIVVVSDACADSTPSDHLEALNRMEGPTCSVATTTDVRDALALRPSPNRRHAIAGTERVKSFLPSPTESVREGTNPYHLIFPPPQRLEVGASDTVLLVLDAHALATRPDSLLFSAALAADPALDLDPLLSRINDALTALAKLVDTAHDCGLPVIHVRTAGRTSAGRDVTPAVHAVVGNIPAGHPAIAIDDRLPQSQVDLILAKPGQGPFTGTGLDETLRNLGITKLILGGISTLGAVEAALRGASDRGYQVLLVPEACAADTSAGQRKLEVMGAGLIEVTDKTDAMDRIRAARGS